MSDRIDEDRVQHIARLARLKLTDEEIHRFGAQLGDILKYVEKLNEVDVTGVEPVAHPLSVCNVFREDEPREPLGTQRVLANAPAQEAGYFKVPKVLEQGSA